MWFAGAKAGGGGGSSGGGVPAAAAPPSQAALRSWLQNDDRGAAMGSRKLRFQAHL